MPKISKTKKSQLDRIKKMNEIKITKRKLLALLGSSDQHVNQIESKTIDENLASNINEVAHIENNQNLANVITTVQQTNDEKASGSKFDEYDDYELLISTEEEDKIKETHIGRRIINLSHFTKQLLEICSHEPLGCTPSSIILVGEKKKGLMSTFSFKCKKCHSKFTIQNDTNEDDYLNLNSCAVAGAIAIGCGRSQLEEFLSAMNLSTITERIYDHNHKLISKHWEKVAVENMLEAGKKEMEIAISNGKVSKDGFGIIEVIVDGCWCKRSYKKNYSALSGAAAIIGKNTGKILFLGVKNKYCQVCTLAEKNSVEAKEHYCFKNYQGPSTSMESEILVEGFKASIEQHGLIYSKMVSDGDSSTYAKILEARPYPDITVEKIECKNHLMRNFCNKLQVLTTETKYPPKDRKRITHKSIMTMRAVIIKAIKKHKNNSDVHLLFEDILLCHLHAFGDHSKCRQYFCNNIGVCEGLPTDFFLSAVWQKINYIVQGIASHSRSLIYDVDSNAVENFHSIVAKLVGGKRINFAKKNSYSLRVNAAAVAFNNKKTISRLYKSLNGGQSPSGRLKKLENDRIKKAALNKLNKKPKRRLFQQTVQKGSIDYGEECAKPDMDDETYEKVKHVFLQNLYRTDAALDDIQKNTILQSESGEWMELRRSLLTASNFGKVIKRRSDTSCTNFIKELLYKSNIDHISAIKHGRDNESTALSQLSAQLNVEIKKCGLFIDKEFPYFGATPDGVCPNEDAVVEIKCPLTAYKLGMAEAIVQKKVTFWKTDGKTINKAHNWYFQVQGQLRVTQRSKCIFAVWSNNSEPLKVQVIERDDRFWKDKMESKLKNFYIDCILPELIDPRHPRRLPIRNPRYIEEALKIKEDKKLQKVPALLSTINAVIK